MRMLLTTCPGVGHLLPLLPLARAAHSRGHEVRIAAGASLLPIVARAGFAAVPAGPDSLGDVARAIPALAGLTGRKRAVVMVREGFAGRIARSIGDDLLSAFGDDWRPDLIVREDMELGSWLVAERLGIPSATVQVTAWRPRVRALMAESIEPLRREYGLSSDATGRLTGQLFFTTRPPSLRDPGSPFPAPTAELRPIADDEDGAPLDPTASTPTDAATSGSELQLDPFAALPGPAGGPRVAVTLGTVNADQHVILRMLIDGAVAAGARVVVGLGSDPASFGPVARSVAVHRYVPMSVLLPAADVVAFHGGSGTLTAALAAACPMVIAPIAADQPDNAELAVAAGVAQSIPSEALTVDLVHAAIDAVLSDPAYPRRAGEVAAEIAAMPGPEVAAERLERLVPGG
jgi:UDP:flavonoid glycosyltransferase YjiC (YdhE family)